MPQMLVLIFFKLSVKLKLGHGDSMLSLSSKWRKMLWYTSPNVSPSSLSKALRRLEAILCYRFVSIQAWKPGRQPGGPKLFTR